MRSRFEFSVRCELRLQEGNWPHLRFEREGFLMSVEKPVATMKPLLALEMLSTPKQNMRTSEAAEIAFFLRIAVEVEPSQGDGIPAEGGSPDQLAWRSLNEILVWIRVLTRQYWIGYRERWESGVSYEELELGVTPRKAKSGVQIGLAFEYGQPLDEKMWAMIQINLADEEKPSASQLFFCDALLDISEADISQATVALGIACELELQNLIDEALALRDEGVWKLFKRYAKYQFGDMLKIPSQLGGKSFGDVDSNAARLVQELHDLRGKAAHGKKLPAGLNVGQYIDATEKLFAWASAQRVALSTVARAQAAHPTSGA